MKGIDPYLFAWHMLRSQVTTLNAEDICDNYGTSHAVVTLQKRAPHGCCENIKQSIQVYCSSTVVLLYVR